MSAPSSSDSGSRTAPGPSSAALTWAALLARWMELARAAVALPRDAEGDRWRASIAAVIELHAITMALGDIADLPTEERAVARDRAAVGVRRAAATLGSAWRAVQMPEAIREFEEAAAAALRITAWAGARELVWRGAEHLAMPILPGLDPVLDGSDCRGSLWVVPPGTPVTPGAPMAWWVDREDPPLVQRAPDAPFDAPWSECEIRAVRVPKQVFRVIDDSGKALEDRLMPLAGLDATALPAGLPLLVPLLDQGRVAGAFPADLGRWHAMHAAALPSGRRLPLRESAGEE